MDELTKLAIKYGTDKWGKHHYTPVYYEMFKDRREEIKKLLEIGVAEGAGLFMFRDFFPNATIYGGEIDKKRVNKLKKLNRIEVYELDQSSVSSIVLLSMKIYFDFDIIIDDGSHEPLDQIFTCHALMPFLPKGSTYIIEDVKDSDVATLLSRNYYVEVKEVGDRYDDRLVIIRK